MKKFFDPRSNFIFLIQKRGFCAVKSAILSLERGGAFGKMMSCVFKPSLIQMNYTPGQNIRVKIRIFCCRP